MHSNRYTFLYAIGLSVLTAIVLVVASEKLKPAQQANISLDKKKNILQSVLITETDRNTVENTYKNQVAELVVNSKGEVLEGENANDIVLKEQVGKKPEERQMPLYVYTKEDGKKCYVVPLQGVGLWGPIWGYISLEDDFNTIYGAYFDHKSETPGLGAEIAEKPFQEQFKGKKVMTAEKGFISVNVVKKTIKLDVDDAYRVDAISGGTITSNGTDAMIKNCLEPYYGYFNTLKK